MVPCSSRRPTISSSVTSHVYQHPGLLLHAFVVAAVKGPAAVVVHNAWTLEMLLLVVVMWQSSLRPISITDVTIFILGKLLQTTCTP